MIARLRPGWTRGEISKARPDERDRPRKNAPREPRAKELPCVIGNSLYPKCGNVQHIAL